MPLGSDFPEAQIQVDPLWHRASTGYWITWGSSENYPPALILTLVDAYRNWTKQQHVGLYSLTTIGAGNRSGKVFKHKLRVTMCPRGK